MIFHIKCKCDEEKNIITVFENHLKSLLVLFFGFSVKKLKNQIFENRIKFKVFLNTMARCLKITEKVSFNIASEASYVYILSGKKLIKNAKNGQFGEFLKT